jgi:hypothetical protein
MGHRRRTAQDATSGSRPQRPVYAAIDIPWASWWTRSPRLTASNRHAGISLLGVSSFYQLIIKGADHQPCRPAKEELGGLRQEIVTFGLPRLT